MGSFDKNIREYLRDLREDQRLCDVTLVTDDGKHIHAHKVILSSGSNFFRDVFLKSNHSNMLIYLKGTNSADLENVIDFIYNGEACIGEENLKQFIETGKELQIKGLVEDLMEFCKNLTGNPKSAYNSSPSTDIKNEKETDGEDINYILQDVDNESDSQDYVVSNVANHQVYDVEIENVI